VRATRPQTMQSGPATLPVLGAVLLACARLAPATSDEPHPVEKVITLLQGLQEKVKFEGKQEAVLYGKFQYWCQTSIKDVDKAIGESKEAIEELEDDEAALTKEETALNGTIAKLEAKILDLDKADTTAAGLREEEAEVYRTANEDYGSTIQALAGAIQALESALNQTDPSEPSVFLEQMRNAQHHVRRVLSLMGTSAMDQEQRLALTNWSAPEEEANLTAPTRPPLLARGDEQAHVDVYKFKSHSVIELLKKLKSKFADDQLKATKEETNALNAYALAKQARDAEEQATRDAKGLKETRRGDVQGALGDARSHLKSSRDDLAADEGTLATTKKSCTVKKEEWEERSMVRKRELQAMDAAIKIMAKVAGVRTEAPSNPVPPPAPVETGEATNGAGAGLFLQVARDPRQRALSLLRDAARAAHSHALERLAVEVAAHLAGPFDNVIGMIEKMIFRLKAEQNNEDEHKNWCDQEASKTETSKSDKELKIDELDGKITEANDKVQVLTNQIAEAQQMVADIEAFVKEATEIRQVGKHENALSIKDAQDAQTAIANAVAVLETFYKSTGVVSKESWEFLQRGGEPVQLPDKPDTWQSSYVGVADPKEQSVGIITVLETVASDFAVMEGKTRAAEAADQSLFEQQMKSHAVEKARRLEDVEMKGHEKKRLMDKATAWTATRKHVSDELESVKQYLKDLRPACVDGDSTYEDRKAARAKELEALQQAQVILQQYSQIEVTTPAPAAKLFLQWSRDAVVARHTAAKH